MPPVVGYLAAKESGRIPSGITAGACALAGGAISQTRDQARAAVFG
jgi:hypothetical protein